MSPIFHLEVGRSSSSTSNSSGPFQLQVHVEQKKNLKRPQALAATRKHATLASACLFLCCGLSPPHGLQLEQSQLEDEGYDGCPQEDFQTLRGSLSSLLSVPNACEKQVRADPAPLEGQGSDTNGLYDTSGLYAIDSSAFVLQAGESVQRCITALAKQGKVELTDLADLLCSQGFRAVLRSAPGGGHGMDCFKNLAYRFICLQAEGDTGCCPQLIVDPHFK